MIKFDDRAGYFIGVKFTVGNGVSDDDRTSSHLARARCACWQAGYRGTRLAVEFVIGLMADGWCEADILTNYPNITHDDIIACLAYARDTLSSEKVYPSAA
jgi:uncharacterized protein (DUF433 family)